MVEIGTVSAGMSCVMSHAGASTVVRKRRKSVGGDDSPYGGKRGGEGAERGGRTNVGVGGRLDWDGSRRDVSVHSTPLTLRCPPTLFREMVTNGASTMAGFAPQPDIERKKERTRRVVDEVRMYLLCSVSPMNEPTRRRTSFDSRSGGPHRLAEGERAEVPRLNCSLFFCPLSL